MTDPFTTNNVNANPQPLPQCDADVVFVGGGPVGTGLAIELGQQGVRCVVIERYTQPQPIPKGQNLTQRTMGHFHFCGAEKRLRAALPAPGQRPARLQRRPRPGRVLRAASALSARLSASPAARCAAAALRAR